jgi:hypothetical protein
MEVVSEAYVVTPVGTVLRLLQMPAVPAVSVFDEQHASAPGSNKDDTHDDLPVVCKKLSCPQGSSRRGALIGAGADGCSADERCKSVARRATRESVMMEDLTVILLEMITLMYST